MRTMGAIAVVAVLLAAAGPAAADEARRARFSGKRLALEIGAGALTGVATYAGFSSMCDGDDGCLGPAIGALVVDVAATPLVVWGVGKWAGGRGGLGSSYLGASVAFTPLSTPNVPVGTSLAVGIIMMPITTALLYEVSSHFTALRAEDGTPPALGVQPIYGQGGVDGALGSFAMRF